jgi:hypothetical protein
MAERRPQPACVVTGIGQFGLLHAGKSCGQTAIGRIQRGDHRRPAQFGHAPPHPAGQHRLPEPPRPISSHTFGLPVRSIPAVTGSAACAFAESGAARWRYSVSSSICARRTRTAEPQWHSSWSVPCDYSPSSILGAKRPVTCPASNSAMTLSARSGSGSGTGIGTRGGAGADGVCPLKVAVPNRLGGRSS